ncbi:glycoside-pentoside-hexuronide (GPH):cation symporter [Paenibacillus sp. MMS20-IR301]|uniref:MFS transporter n=1 Tax=Paenibacillus sp. MMS20-IR301 TaxID=2895946 RepID=UPI0028EE1748|nr:glycoside-pentoside-hexuronide (GPH):cation symporter [Paenibacillus sp. MMS20-IR301]WNS43951.1 glycoside-pentoside-hexuronide (GPH):cation symporter [Paenibacillus sp. MMS20-IR301]
MLRWNTKLLYGSGETVNVITITVIGMYYLFFLTDYAGLSPALAGAVFMIGRIWDAFIDPVMGIITDRTRTRWGRRRPFLLLSAVPVGLFFYLMWSDPGAGSVTLNAVYFTATYMLFMTTLTLYYVPYLSLVAELTDDYDERTSVNNYRIIVQLLMGLVAAVIPKMIADSYADPFQGYRIMALTAGLFIILIPLLLFFRTRERERGSAVDKVDTPRFGSEIRLALGSRAFRLLLLLYVGCYAASNVIEGFVIYYMKYWLHREEEMSYLLVTVILAGVLTLPLWTKVSRAAGKKITIISGLLLWAVSQLAWILLTPDSPAYLVYLIGAIVGTGYGVAHVIPWSMLPDVLDADELRTGLRREGLYSGIMTFFMKTSNSLAIFLIGILLEASGYVPNQIQEGPARWTIRTTMTFAPELFIITGLIAAFLYPLGKEDYKRNREQLLDKREASLNL